MALEIERQSLWWAESPTELGTSLQLQLVFVTTGNRTSDLMNFDMAQG